MFSDYAINHYNSQAFPYNMKEMLSFVNLKKDLQRHHTFFTLKGNNTPPLLFKIAIETILIA